MENYNDAHRPITNHVILRPEQQKTEELLNTFVTDELCNLPGISVILERYRLAKIGVEDVQNELKSASIAGEFPKQIYAPIFIGNNLPRSKYHIGYNAIFGRVLVGDLKSAYPLKRFETYLCAVERLDKVCPKVGQDQRNSLGCYWIASRILCSEIPVKFNPLATKITVTPTCDGASSKSIFSSKTLTDGVRVDVYACDLSEHCAADLPRGASILVAAFPRDEHFVSCYATIRREFNFDELKNSVPSTADKVTKMKCCEIVEPVYELFTKLLATETFYTQYLLKNEEMRERMFACLIDSDEEADDGTSNGETTN